MMSTLVQCDKKSTSAQTCVHSIKGLLATGACDLGEFLTALVLNILLAYQYIMAEYQAY